MDNDSAYGWLEWYQWYLNVFDGINPNHMWDCKMIMLIVKNEWWSLYQPFLVRHVLSLPQKNMVLKWESVNYQLAMMLPAVHIAMIALSILCWSQLSVFIWFYMYNTISETISLSCTMLPQILDQLRAVWLIQSSWGRYDQRRTHPFAPGEFKMISGRILPMGGQFVSSPETRTLARWTIQK